MPEFEIKFQSSLDEVQLTGTLATPDIPARGSVLLIGGSGKIDRDETMPATNTASGKTEKLFKQVSDTLLQRGFRTFRYDKRGVLGSSGAVDRAIWATADRNHLISDAVDAARLFCNLQKFLPADLILLGHSEGTVIAVESAIRLGARVKGLILLGAIARSFKDLVRYQILESADRPVENLSASEDDVNRILEEIVDSKEVFHPDDDKPISYYRQMLEAEANHERIKLLNTKIAVFQGRLDYLTPVDELEKFRSAGVQLTISKVYDDLGHAFSKVVNDQSTLGPIEDHVLQDIADAASLLSE